MNAEAPLDFKPGPAWEAARRYGVDMDHLRAQLARTPAERLELHGRVLNTLTVLRAGMERRRARAE